MYFDDTLQHTHEILPIGQLLQLESLQPAFYDLLRQIPDWQELPILLVRYPYGAIITESGQFFINLFGSLTPFKDPKTPPAIRTLLQYPWLETPMAIILNGFAEEMIDTTTGSPPVSQHFRPGDFLSASHLIEPFQAHRLLHRKILFAGARSLICLSSLSDMQFGLRLSHFYGFKPLYPKSYSDQAILWNALAQHAHYTEHWHLVCAFFSAKLIDTLRHTLSMIHYFQSDLFQQATYHRFQGHFRYIWHHFLSDTLSPTHPNLRIAEYTSGLLFTLMGFTSGFAPCPHTQDAPVGEISMALANHYKLRYHYPILLQSAFYTHQAPIYLSLQHWIIHMNPLFQNAQAHALSDIQAIRQLFLRFKEWFFDQYHAFQAPKNQLEERLETAKIDFYHLHAKAVDGVSSDIRAIFDEDPRFEASKTLFEDRNLDFPIRATFFLGLIRIQNPEYMMTSL